VATNGLEQTSPSIANKGDHSMPTLQNPRHERFAQELATGKSADAAYVLAGYRENRSNAARLSANRDIQKRVAEIQLLGAERAAITVETLMAEAEEARSKAMSEKGGAAAAIAAITAKAKLAGLWRENVAQNDPSGEHAPRYIISERPMTEEEWIRDLTSPIRVESSLPFIVTSIWAVVQWRSFNRTAKKR
jgi:phage terminase small subunit